MHPSRRGRRRGGGGTVVDESTCPFIGSWRSLVWERRTTCWVTIRVPDPNILVVRHPPPFRKGWDFDHHVSACSVGARACWGPLLTMEQKNSCVLLRVVTNALFMTFPVLHDVCYVKGR